jgi:hypothetical protein
VKGPGLIILIPVVQQMVKVDLRVMVQEVPPQDVIARRGSHRYASLASALLGPLRKHSTPMA